MDNFYKQNDTDIIWWVENKEKIGEYLFTFDKKRIFNLFRDYPYQLSEQEKEIFDKENPYWANYFKDRNYKTRKNSNSTQYLTRKELAEKFYGYHSKNNINDSTATMNYLKILSDFLNTYQYSLNDNFVFAGRKKFIYDEIVAIINGEKKVENPLYFLLGSLEEFISNDNQIYPSEDDYVSIRTKNDNYITDRHICQQEKDIVLGIINQISDFISRQTLNQQSNTYNIAKEIVKKIEEIPTGKKFTMVTLFKDYDLSTENMFKVMQEVMELCKKNGIKVKNTSENTELGLPWVFPLIKE